MRLHNGIIAGQRLKFILRRNKGKTGKLRNNLCNTLRVPLRGVDPGAHGRTAQRKLAKMGKGVLQGSHTMVNLRNVAREFLPHGERGGIHHMGAPNLHHIPHLLASRGQRIAEPLQPRQSNLHKLLIGRNVHRGGEGIVARLRFVNIIVRMNNRFPLTETVALKL